MYVCMYVCTDIHRYSPIYIGCPSLVYLSWSPRWPKVLSTYTHGGCSTEISRYASISRSLLLLCWSLSVYTRSPLTRRVTHTHTHTHTTHNTHNTHTHTHTHTAAQHPPHPRRLRGQNHRSLLRLKVGLFCLRMYQVSFDTWYTHTHTYTHTDFGLACLLSSAAANSRAGMYRYVPICTDMYHAYRGKPWAAANSRVGTLKSPHIVGLFCHIGHFCPIVGLFWHWFGLRRYSGVLFCWKGRSARVCP
jgi:hypothetical protein